MQEKHTAPQALGRVGGEGGEQYTMATRDMCAVFVWCLTTQVRGISVPLLIILVNVSGACDGYMHVLAAREQHIAVLHPAHRQVCRFSVCLQVGWKRGHESMGTGEWSKALSPVLHKYSLCMMQEQWFAHTTLTVVCACYINSGLCMMPTLTVACTCYINSGLHMLHQQWFVHVTLTVVCA